MNIPPLRPFLQRMQPGKYPSELLDRTTSLELTYLEVSVLVSALEIVYGDGGPLGDPDIFGVRLKLRRRCLDSNPSSS